MKLFCFLIFSFLLFISTEADNEQSQTDNEQSQTDTGEAELSASVTKNSLDCGCIASCEVNPILAGLYGRLLVDKKRIDVTKRLVNEIQGWLNIWEPAEPKLGALVQTDQSTGTDETNDTSHETAPDDTLTTPETAPDDTLTTPETAPDDTLATPANASDDTLTTPETAPDDTLTTPETAPDDTLATPANASDDTTIPPKDIPDDNPNTQKANPPIPNSMNPPHIAMTPGQTVPSANKEKTHFYQSTFFFVLIFFSIMTVFSVYFGYVSRRKIKVYLNKNWGVGRNAKPYSRVPTLEEAMPSFAEVKS